MIRKVVKISAWVLSGIVGLAVLALAVVWMLGGLKLGQKFTVPDIALTASADPDIVSHGEHLAAITGCSGCHAARMQGEVVFEIPDGTRVVAPNIPRLASTYSDQDLARVIRYGVKPNRKPVMFMPSEAFFAVTDEDMVAVLSYIRATKDEGAEPLPKNNTGPLIRFMLASGKLKIAAAMIKDMTTRPEYDFNSEIDRGAYLAMIACAECHGVDFKGQTFDPDYSPPDLIVASAYLPEEFSTLMKMGVASGGRKLGLMEDVSIERFSHFTDAEIADLYAFLRHRAMNPQ